MRSRSRERWNEPAVRSWVIYDPGNNIIGGGSDGPYKEKILHEFIRDLMPRPGYRTPPEEIKPCLHRTARTEWLLGGHTYWDNVGNRYTYSGARAHATMQADLVFSAVPFCGIDQFSAGFLNDVVADAWNTLSQDAQDSWEMIPTEIELANDLLELRQLRSLANPFRDLLRSFTDPSLRLRRSTDGTINAFLAYNFGLLPLMGTLKGLALSLARISRRLDFLRSTRGRRVTLTMRRRFAFNSTPPSGWGNPSTPFQEYYEANVVYDALVGVRLFHTLDGLDAADAGLRAFRDYAGFNRIATIAWNAIPFSFVVDWVADVSSKLDRIQLPPVFGGTYYLSNPWHSVSMSGTVKCHKWHYPSHNGPVTWSIHGVKGYIRVPNLPPMTPNIGITWLQLALLGALGAQRWELPF